MRGSDDRQRQRQQAFLKWIEAAEVTEPVSQDAAEWVIERAGEANLAVDARMTTRSGRSCAMKPTLHGYSTAICTNWSGCRRLEMGNPLPRRWLWMLTWPVSAMDRNQHAANENTFLQNELKFMQKKGHFLTVL